MITIKKENVAVAVHPKGKQINPIFSIETQGTVAEVGVVIDVTKGPGNVSQRRLLTMQEVSENEPNFYNLTFEAVIDNADADVEIKVTVRNSQGEEDSAVLTFDRDPYADR